MGLFCTALIPDGLDLNGVKQTALTGCLDNQSERISSVYLRNVRSEFKKKHCCENQHLNFTKNRAGFDSVKFLKQANTCGKQKNSQYISDRST